MISVWLRGVNLGSVLGFLQTSQNELFDRGIVILMEKTPVQTVALKLKPHNSLEYNYVVTLRFVLMKMTKVIKPVHLNGASQYFCPCSVQYILYTGPTHNTARF